MKDKILVVDDEDTTRRSLADILRLEGYRVLAVASGEEAIDTIKREVFDLVLLDLKMPGMDGLEVLRNVSDIAPDMMVILLTAHGSLQSAIEALRHDAYDYLLKPSSPQQILKSVAGALGRRAESERKRALLEQLDDSIRKLRNADRKVPSIPADSHVIPLGNGVIVDLERREVWQRLSSGEEKKAQLTPTEGKLLKVLLENRGQVFTHRELVAMVQGYDVNDHEAPEVLRPVVSRLRRKLDRFPGGMNWIVNIRGTGYLFELKAESTT